MRCTTCNGDGAAPGTRPVTCAECAGAGQIRRVRQSMLGQMMTTSACPRCGGLGQVIVTPCETCAGHGRLIEDRAYQVDVPGGVDSGSTLRLAGRGAVGPRGGRGRRPLRARGGAPARALLPGRPRPGDHGPGVDRPGRARDDHHPAHPRRRRGAAHPGRLAVRQGLHPAGPGRADVRGRGRGDLRAELVVQVPTKLTATQEELLRRLADEMGETVEPPGGNGLFSRIKSAFS